MNNIKFLSKRKVNSIQTKYIPFEDTPHYLSINSLCSNQNKLNISSNPYVDTKYNHSFFAKNKLTKLKNLSG